MFKKLNERRQKGQSTLEYFILIIIIIGALLSIQVYIKRGIQGRLKSATDDIGIQFSPGNQNANTTTTVSGQSRDTFEKGVTKSTLTKIEVTTDTMTTEVLNVEQEFWGVK